MRSRGHGGAAVLWQVMPGEFLTPQLHITASRTGCGSHYTQIHDVGFKLADLTLRTLEVHLGLWNHY